MNIDDLKQLVDQELADERFLTRTHGRGSTYRDGCKGPLCQRANRRRHNRIRTGRPDTAGYQAILDKMLEPFQRAHDLDRAEMMQKKGA